MVEDSAPDNVIALHGGKINAKIPHDSHDEPEDNSWAPMEVLEAYKQELDGVDSLVIIGVKHGQICWSSTSKSLLEIIWLCEALKRVAMDHSLGIIDLDESIIR